MNLVETARKVSLRKAAVMRVIWLLIAVGVVSLLLAAAPLRYQMLEADVYGFEDGLHVLGISTTFFAVYFTVLELIVAFVSLIVAALIVWKRPDDWFAMLTAITLTLLGLLPPLADGLIFAFPQWAGTVSFLRLIVNGCTMALLCLFPNGRFIPRWTLWLVFSWIILSVAAFLVNPQILSDMAILPNTRTAVDGIWLLAGAAWFTAAIGGQMIRYRKYASLTEQRQTKWVLWGFTVVIPVTVIAILLLISVPSLQILPANRAFYTIVMGGLMLVAALAIPITIAISILRYRLWQVDILLNRTLIYGGLTILISAVYVLLVGGIGSLAVGGRANLAAFMVVTVLILLGIRPLHHRLQTRVDRLLPPPPRTTSDNKRIDVPGLLLMRTAWGLNAATALMLLTAGLIVQNAYGFWQPLPMQSLTAIPVLAGGLTDNSFVQTSTLYPFLLVAAYFQAVAFAALGIFLFWRKSRDPMAILASWMLIAVGLGFTPTIVFLPLVNPAWHLLTSLFQASLFVSVFLFLCLFPNGRFFPHWSRYAAAAWLIFTLLWLPFPQLNPHRATTVGPPLIFAAVVFLGIGFQLFRYRRLSAPDEKQQAKWVIAGFAAANLGLFAAVLLLGSGVLQSAPALSAAVLLLGMASILIPLTIVVALFRYRLWDIDIIINRTLVYGGLSLGIIVVYILVVGAFGALFQSQGGFLYALLATGLIAVLFQPVRERLQRGVNRLMFGDRDDPYAALVRLGSQLQTTSTPEAMLQSTVATIASTLKLPYVAIKLADEQGQLGGASTGKAVAAVFELPLLYQNERVGNLVASPRSPGESFTRREQRLLADMAAHAGAVAYSVRLTAALQRSREKLVLAREEERRRIRRDLHDELGPTLASQTFALDTALESLEGDPQTTAQLLRSLKKQNKETVADIRRLVYELRPPALDELGLVGALQALIAQLDGRSQPDITMTAIPDPLPPLSAAVEVAAYRIAREAINNVVRHANARRCTAQLKITGSGQRQLQISVTDDGIGLPEKPKFGVGIQSMRERAEELGGHFQLHRRERGTKVTAVLPILRILDA